MGLLADMIHGLTEAAVTKAAERAPGFDGVPIYAGYVSTGERNRKLQGSRRWVTLADARRRMPVSIATQLRAALFAGVTWTLEPNPAGGELAQRGVELVQRGLLDARFAGGRSWQDVVARAADGRYFLGHSVHATALGRMRSGQIGYLDIAHRPQHTIERWRREVDNDETTPIIGIEQIGRAHV